jgi:hypothetical protein
MPAFCFSSFHDVADVISDGEFGEMESHSDLFVGQASRNQIYELKLALSKSGTEVSVVVNRISGGSKLLGHILD